MRWVALKGVIVVRLGRDFGMVKEERVVNWTRRQKMVW